MKGDTRAGHQPLPSWSPADLAAAAGPGPVALFEGLSLDGRPCALVAWASTAHLPTLAEAQAEAAAVPLPEGAPTLLGAAVGNIGWDGAARFWIPAGAALFDWEQGRLWTRGELPPVKPGQADPVAPNAGQDHPVSDQIPTRAARPLWDLEAYCAAVREAQTEMAAGRLVKVILSVPFLAPCQMAPLQVYRRLTADEPPGLRFLLDDGSPGRALIGLSPEPLVLLTGRRAEMHLLAGTRPEGAGHELLESPKDREEHAVAVEQARQDLLSVCLPDSVSVDAFMELERHPGLVHLASHLSGLLCDGSSPADLVYACFPASTVGGIPRGEARALIDRLEPAPRDWYAGAVGVLLPNGDLQLWLAIRSLRLADGWACIRTGAGLVASSRPEAEWQECLNKARRALAAVGAEAR